MMMTMMLNVNVNGQQPLAKNITFYSCQWQIYTKHIFAKWWQTFYRYMYVHIKWNNNVMGWWNENISVWVHWAGHGQFIIFFALNI